MDLSMRSCTRRWLIMIGIALVGLVLAATCTPRAGERAWKGEVPSEPVIVAGVTLPEVQADGTSAPFAMRAQPGGVLLVFFGFVNCPDICPTTLSDVRRALELIGPASRAVHTAFVTVDPQRDSAQVMRDYLGSFFAERAHALRPSTQRELGLAQGAFRATSTITRERDGHIDVSHTATLYAVDASGRVLVEWPFGTPAADIAHDLRRLTAAAHRGEPAPAAEAEPGFAAADSLGIAGVWVRASPRGATMGAAYLTLRSLAGDQLIDVSVSDSLAEHMEMHEIVDDGSGALRMQQVDAIALPAGERVTLEPGGRHLMFIGLRRPLVAGTSVTLRLRFERAGERVVTAAVRED